MAGRSIPVYSLLMAGMGFEEESHPRDEHGKFAAGGGGGGGGSKKAAANEASKGAGRETAATGGDGLKHFKASEAHAAAFSKHYAAAKEARAKAEATSDPMARSQHMAEHSSHMSQATKHRQKADSERAKATAATETSRNASPLSSFVAKHTAAPKADVPKPTPKPAPPPPVAKTAAPKTPAAPKSGLGAFVAKHVPVEKKAEPAAKKPAATEHDDHAAVIEATKHVDAAGRHHGLVPIPEIRDHLSAKGWDRPRLDKALLSGHLAMKFDMKTANDPSRMERPHDSLVMPMSGASGVAARSFNKEMEAAGSPHRMTADEHKYYVTLRD